MVPYFMRQIGADRFLDAAEVPPGGGEPSALHDAWEVYRTHFQSFTGASLDPQYEALGHPASQLGSVHIDAGVTVLVVGTGPSLAANIKPLKRLRSSVRIFTSPRGAEALLGHGIVPDLVLVEHQTALDAHHSARHVGDRRDAVLPSCPLVAAEWKTPAALLAGVPSRSLFVPASAATWGLWPATAVAMALDGGASCVALLGIDLGTRGQIDRAHAPLAALLGLFAARAEVPTVDCGDEGAIKDGWLKAPLAAAAGSPVYGTCEISVARTPSRAERIGRAREAFLELGPIVERALDLSRLAIDARAGRLRQPAALEAGVAEMMAWRSDRGTRALLQESLGAGFLPRLWRIGVDMTLGPALWRPLMLATHEIVGQAEALTSLFTLERAA